ncbi:hypothetical protein FACS189441_8230 [Betaproteobacteria bacterium]|nr:hypothetical protein FACS189441_8230 [Betaproteobacteria bacterium]
MQKERDAHPDHQDIFLEISNMEILAKHIVNFRKANGLSQKAFADLCKLHRTYIGSIERLERNVSVGTLEVIAQTIGIPVFMLFIPTAIDYSKRISPLAGEKGDSSATL